MVDGFNKTRKRECKWGWCSIIDETTFAWRGKSGTGGVPHLACRTFRALRANPKTLDAS
jgi:hypothetical protein